MIGDTPPGPGSARRVREERRRRRHALVACALAALGLAAVLAWQRPWQLLPPAAAPEAPAGAEAPAPAPEPAPAEEPGEGAEQAGEFEPSGLPPVADSDAFVREHAGAASRRPEWAAWLAGEGLALRFVAAVEAVAAGESPRDDLPELAPRGAFEVAAQGDRQVIAPASFARFDLATAVFTSLDVGLCVRAYRALGPLFDRALVELGSRERRFDAVLARAFRELLSAPVPQGALEVVPKVRSYELADPELEALSPAQKQLLRLGPVNAMRVQQKLQELEDALGLAPAR
jgi:hypothetical protein